MLTEKVVDTLIRSMRASGLLADDGSADAIRAAPNDATEGELDAIAAGLNYGGVGGGAQTASTGDVDIFIDSDGLPNTPHSNFLRVSQRQGGPPTIDFNNELFTFSTPANASSRDLDGPVLIIGPRSSLTPTLGMRAELHVGTPVGGGSLDYFFSVIGSPKIVSGGEGCRISTSPSGSMDIRSSDQIQFRNIAGTSLKGGWDDFADSESHFHIGDYQASESWVLETIPDDVTSSFKHLQLRSITTSGERKLYIIGSQTGSAEAAVRVSIGGEEGTLWGDPITGLETTCLIVSPRLGADNRNTLYLNHRSESLLTNQEIFTINSEDLLGNFAYMMRVFRAGAADSPIFHIDMDGNVRADGTFTTPAADVAEWVTVEGEASDYAHGTVLTVSENGKMEKSVSVADPKVMGVTVDPSSPAVSMGQGNGYNESGASDLGHAPTMTGTLTELVFAGDITGDLLGESHLRVGPDVVPIDPPVHDPDADTTTVTFTGGQTVVRVADGTPILKGIVPETDRLAMTVLGFVPVRAVTVNGTISPGDLLVSAGDGRCARHDDGTPSAGRALGKAVSGLSDDGSGSVTGTVRALINLQ